mmetsp:Transcript_1281/g.1517  ORF Transcript_1281/g.1517 Transcript_1281/m.1517 type:complete len:90 (-) Transcript_1281:45-314(-)
MMTVCLDTSRYGVLLAFFMTGKAYVDGGITIQVPKHFCCWILGSGVSHVHAGIPVQILSATASDQNFNRLCFDKFYVETGLKLCLFLSK